MRVRPSELSQNLPHNAFKTIRIVTKFTSQCVQDPHNI